MTAIEQSANFYLAMNDLSKLQPDRKHLEEIHSNDIAAMRRVRTLIERQCPNLPSNRPPPKPLMEDEAEEQFMNEVRSVIARFEADAVSGIGMLNELSVRALDLMIQDYECFGSTEAKICDGREKHHRKDFIIRLILLWASIHSIPAHKCTISAVDGSPLLEFIKSCLDPVASITKEPAGNETIKNIVNSYRRDHRALETGPQ